LARAGSIAEILTLTKVVKLEHAADSALAAVVDVIAWRDQYYVLDRYQRAVFRFDHAGRYLNRVGRGGQGPGEYLFPKHIGVAFDQYLAVVDGMSGALLLYEPDGRFRRRFPDVEDDRTLRSASPFLWPEPETLIRARLTGLTEDQPAHGLIRNPLDPDRIHVAGFGPRFLPMERAMRNGLPGLAFSAMARVGDQLWLGSPYDCVIQAFDLDGRALGTVTVPHPDKMRADDFERVDRMGHQALVQLLKTYHNFKILPLGELVLVAYAGADGLLIDVLDRHGNPVKTAISDTGMFQHPLNTAGDRLLALYFPPEDATPARLRRQMGESGYALLLAAGFDPQDFSDDNPYLLEASLP
jgi:hypothetical protein